MSVCIMSTTSRFKHIVQERIVSLPIIESTDRQLDSSSFIYIAGASSQTSNITFNHSSFKIGLSDAKFCTKLSRVFTGVQVRVLILNRDETQIVK